MTNKLGGIHPENRIFLPYAQRVIIGNAHEDDYAALTHTLAVHYGSALERAARKKLRVSDPEDALQETYLSMHKAWDRIDWTRPVYVYAHTALKNRGLNAARSQSRRRNIIPHILSELPASHKAHNVAAPEEVSDITELVDLAIGAVSPTMQTVVRARFREGLTYEEIAAEHGIPVGTVKSRLYRGSEQVRAELEKLLTHKE